MKRCSRDPPNPFFEQKEVLYQRENEIFPTAEQINWVLRDFRIS